MARKRSTKKIPPHYKKPLLQVGAPLFITALWFAIGFLLIISGLVDGSPDPGDRVLSEAEYSQYMELYRRTEFWRTVWLGGLAAIFIGGIISASVGTLRVVQHRQSRHR